MRSRAVRRHLSRRFEERQRRLVADVAHELRTPLANLRGYLEALKDGVITPDADLFASQHEEAVHQQRIVDDLQDLALAEAGVLTYHRTEIDLAFDRFWRADSARERRTGGSGLGLAIARQIVTDHGGGLSVDSEVGVGSTFTITLPALTTMTRSPVP